MPQWLIVLSWVSTVLGLATAGAIAADVIRRPQRMAIMNVVWPVTGLYFPLVGWWFYAAMGRPMAVDAREIEGKRAYWRQIFLSATHCGSGCVLGNIIGVPIVFFTGWIVFGERLFAEYVVEFALAYLFGIAFQYFPIRTMRRIPPREAIVEAVKADTFSLAAFEIGMFAWMAAVRYGLLADHPPDASSAVFWFMMQIGMVLGFVTTYPANWLLVRWGVKSAM